VAIGIVLARLLGPHAFGTFAVALVALMAVLSFNELGVSLAIVRWPGEPGEIAPTVATVSLATSLVIYAGCFFGAPAFASAMGAPAAAGVVRVLALNVILDGLVATPAALMQRYFRQGTKMIADQVNNWLGAAVSVGLAWHGMGAMSLAIGRMTGAVAAAILFISLSPQPLRFGFDRTKARALLRFGLPLAGSSIIGFAVVNVDQLVVGHMLGATALGLYALALNLASWPVNMFSLPVRSVAPAVFSRLQHEPAAMRSGFLSATGLLGVTMPVCLLISGSAVPLLGFVYGPKWVPAAAALRWLGALAALRIIYELVYDFFVVLARSRVVFTLQLAWLLVLVPALVAGCATAGIAGAGLAELIVAACLVLPWYLAELSRIGIRRREVARRLWLPGTAAIGVGCAAAVAARTIPFDLAALAAGGLVALVAVGLLGYRMRTAIAALRPGIAPRPADAAPGSAAPGSTTPGDTTPGGTTRGDTRPGGTTPGDTAAAVAPAAAFQPWPRDVVISPPTAADITGPLPLYRDATRTRSAGRDSIGPLPVYQQTVAALAWDPRPRSPSGPGDDREAGGSSEVAAWPYGRKKTRTTAR
jgi:PST family polysaccharide transporter